jgi:hypothetical protein
MDEEEVENGAATGIEVEVPGIEIEAVDVIDHQAVKRKNNKIENEAVNAPKVEEGKEAKVLVKEGEQKVPREVGIDKDAFLQLKKIQNIQMNHH